MRPIILALALISCEPVQPPLPAPEERFARPCNYARHCDGLSASVCLHNFCTFSCDTPPVLRFPECNRYGGTCTLREGAITYCEPRERPAWSPPREDNL